jgi:hypothetical protein
MKLATWSRRDQAQARDQSEPVALAGFSLELRGLQNPPPGGRALGDPWGPLRLEFAQVLGAYRTKLAVPR